MHSKNIEKSNLHTGTQQKQKALSDITDSVSPSSPWSLCRQDPYHKAVWRPTKWSPWTTDTSSCSHSWNQSNAPVESQFPVNYNSIFNSLHGNHLWLHNAKWYHGVFANSLRALYWNPQCKIKSSLVHASTVRAYAKFFNLQKHLVAIMCTNYTWIQPRTVRSHLVPKCSYENEMTAKHLWLFNRER